MKSKRRLLSPIRRVGSKGRLARKLSDLLPPHKVYVEVFGGGASLMFAKIPSEVEVYNDLDLGVVTFFRVLRDPAKLSELIKMIRLTPVSRKEWHDCRGWWRQGKEIRFELGESEVHRAWRWFVVAQQGYHSFFATAWGHCPTSNHTADIWLRSPDRLMECAARFRRVAVEWKDWRWVIDRYDSGGTLFYCDPPYVDESRVNPGWKDYPVSMSHQDHKDLVDKLLTIKGMVIISGYQHPIYGKLGENGWTELQRRISSNAAGMAKQNQTLGRFGALSISKRLECLWISPRARRARKAMDKDNAD